MMKTRLATAVAEAKRFLVAANLAFGAPEDDRDSLRRIEGNGDGSPGQHGPDAGAGGAAEAGLPMSLRNDLSSDETRSFEGDPFDDPDYEVDDAFVPFDNLRACTGCFDEIKPESVVKCWTCKKRLCGKPPCARQAAGDTFCSLCWPAAIEAAYEAADADRTRYRNALVLIAVAALDEYRTGWNTYGETAEAALAGDDVPAPTMRQELEVSIKIAKRGKK